SCGASTPLTPISLVSKGELLNHASHSRLTGSPETSPRDTTISTSVLCSYIRFSVSGSNDIWPSVRRGRSRSSGEHAGTTSRIPAPTPRSTRSASCCGSAKRLVFRSTTRSCPSSGSTTTSPGSTKDGASPRPAAATAPLCSTTFRATLGSARTLTARRRTHGRSKQSRSRRPRLRPRPTRNRPRRPTLHRRSHRTRRQRKHHHSHHLPRRLQRRPRNPLPRKRTTRLRRHVALARTRRRRPPPLVRKRATRSGKDLQRRGPTCRRPPIRTRRHTHRINEGYPLRALRG